MQLIHHSSADPAINLALEEVLLDEVEQGHQPDTLRFWESPVPFVVLGTGQALAREVHEDRCLADGTPIMRRCTAGGCVLQGPGSLNYALFLTMTAHPEAASLHGSYRYILNRVCGALATLGLQASHAGISDIAIGGRKVSGNAQRRKRFAILHHGTLLYAPDFDAMERYLREPEERPDYRGTRPHRAFLASVPSHPAAIRQAIANAFGCDRESALPENLLSAAETLACEKYSKDNWIRRR